MLNEGKLEDGLNKTLITLVPKVKDHERIKYKPISLCNMLAKIVTKILANGFKPILPFIISENQSAFLPGNLKRILAEYEIISGQNVNLSKSEIFFGGNVPDGVRGRICEILGVRQVNSMSRYLGLLVAFGHNRKELCKYIVERILKKVQGWKEKALSIAGKETLIKAVVQAMPTYAMSCFKIPESLMKRLVSIISNYWWSNSKMGRGIFWCKYGKLCEEKLEGGLGFRELSTFNEALLAKQILRLLERPDSLVASLPKMRYFKDHSD
ncbi:hypothetical protein QQ045_003415 [Rhodiola kirilowii]